MKFLQGLAIAGSLLSLVEGRFPQKNALHARNRINPRNTAYNKRVERNRMLEKRAPPKKTCNASTTRKIKAPKPNTWGQLTGEETEQVLELLFSDKDLNLTKYENATSWDNTVILVEYLYPNKTEVLPYINGKTDTPPERYAHVVVDIRATNKPYYQELIVGPLPIDNSSAIKPLDYLSNGPNGGKQYNPFADEYEKYMFLTKITTEIADITKDLLNITITDSEDDNGAMWGIDPLWFENDRVISWDMIWGLGDGEFYQTTLLPQGFYIKTDITGRDPSKWKLLGFLYNDIYYESIEELRTAWNSTGFVKNKPNVAGAWSESDHEGPSHRNDNLYPPVMVAPDGGRYRVDVKEKYVEWMGFSFYIGFTRDTGIRLFDIKYEGERILYELGLQEALAHYAGNDPTQSGTAYLDTYYGFGPWHFQLLPGFDCPTYATYMNVSFYMSETHRTNPNSLCLFEQDAGYPIARHTHTSYVTATKNIYLVLRGVATVGNYDYTFDYQFYLDGTIKIEVRASGYIQSAYWAKNEEYGFKIHDNLSGSMHDHVMNFKADFDILGTKNSVATSEFIPTKEVYSWSGGKSRSTMKLKKRFLKTEDEGKIIYDNNNSKSIAIVNKDKKNKYGEYRGWKIMATTPWVHSTVTESSNLLKAAEWSKHHMYITRRKDTEATSYNSYNSVDPRNPVVNFGKYFDGESLEQEDIVVWFNLGMHHAPHTGDLPITVQTVAHASVAITPHNYFLGNPSKRTKHMVRVDFEAGAVNEVKRFGIKEPTCNADLSRSVGTFDDYKGAVVVRKYPYSPRDWYYATADM